MRGLIAGSKDAICQEFITVKSALIALCLVSVLGCASGYQVKMTQSVVPVDRGGRSPALATKQYNKVLIIPPAGTTREQHEALITRFETGFLKQGLSLIASARGQAARAAAEANLEKAIQMLQESGAEAILKIVESKWSDGSEASRFFVLDDLDQQQFREVNENEYRLWNAEKYAFDSPRLHFSGKLVDAATTEVLKTFDMTTAANWNLPKAYEATLALDRNDKWEIVEANFDYGETWWLDEAKNTSEAKLIEEIAKTIKSSSDRVPALEQPSPGE